MSGALPAGTEPPSDVENDSVYNPSCADSEQTSQQTAPTSSATGGTSDSGNSDGKSKTSAGLLSKSHKEGKPKEEEAEDSKSGPPEQRARIAS